MYELPLVRPVTVAVVASAATVTGVPTGASDESYAVTVYPVIGEPPLSLDALQVTVACAVPGLAATWVGGAGAGPATGVTGSEVTSSP